MPHFLKFAALAVGGLLLGGVLLATATAADTKVPSREQLMDMAVQRAALLNCYEGSVDRFDDRISPANVVASAVAWHCEAEGQSSNYWIVLSQRRSSPDTVDAFYRDLALPFVLERRVGRARSG
jgi:hypothetical protein